MIIVSDTETTGLFDFKREIYEVTQPHIVQLGAVLAENDGTVIKELSVIIKPDGYIIPQDSTKIHGITHERAMDEGIPAAEAIAMLDDMAHSAEVHVAHNMSFDMAMINREALALNMETKIRQIPRYCTMKETTNILCLPFPGKSVAGRFKFPKLIELHRFLFGEEFTGAHNALNDALATLRCYIKLMNGDYRPYTFDSDKPQKSANEVAVTAVEMPII